MQLNLSGNLGGKIDEMLQGSVAGDVSFISPSPEPPVLDTLNVTENGTYTPPSGTDGYNEVNVDVPIPVPVLDSLSVTENGTYTPPSGTDGYNEVNVDVPTPVPVLSSLSVTENGTYTPPTGTDGYNEVNVNIPEVWSPITPIIYQIYIESAMGYNGSNYGKFNTTWNGTDSIGLTFNGRINVKDYSKIIIDIDDIGDSYNRQHSGGYDRFDVNFGISTEQFYTFINIGINTQGKIIRNQRCDVTDNYGQSYHYEMDISDITQDCYFYLCMSGCALTGVSIKLSK